METLILEGKGFVGNSTDERVGFLRFTHKEGNGLNYIEYFLTCNTTTSDTVIYCQNAVVSATNGGVLSKQIIVSLGANFIRFYVYSNDLENITISNANSLTSLFGNSTYNQTFNGEDVMNYATNIAKYNNGYFESNVDFKNLMLLPIDNIVLKSFSTEIIDYNTTYGAEFDSIELKKSGSYLYKNLSYLLNNIKNGYNKIVISVFNTENSADSEIIDVAPVIDKCIKTDPSSLKFIELYTGYFTYSSGITFPPNVYLQLKTESFTESMLDNLFIDAALDVVDGYLLITCPNISRTTASDFAISTLNSNGVEVKVNNVIQ